MKLPSSAHTSQRWRVHDIAPDFRLEDVWSLPTLEHDDDLHRLVELIVAFDPAQSTSFTVRTLFAARWKLGKWFGWDARDKSVGGAQPSLRERVPADLRAHPGPAFDALPFTSLYETDDEFAAEIANRTMHGVLHVGRVPAGARGWRGQMAVLVRPNGRGGEAYMAAIRPFRHFLVYPQMFRELEQRWLADAGSRSVHLP